MELLALGVGYQVYKAIRKSAAPEAGPALEHALDIVRWERAVGLFQEGWAQRQLLAHPWFLQAADLYYGTVHFVAPVLVLIALYRTAPARYRCWRTVLVLTTAGALIGFKWYPLAPPRLLPDAFHFVDTVARFGGEGVLNNGDMKDVDNLYAAMPSLHMAWSTWCALAAWPLAPRWWTKAILVLYPTLTLIVVVVTANHFVLDAVGGWILLALSWVLVTVVGRVRTSARLRAVAGEDLIYG